MTFVSGVYGGFFHPCYPSADPPRFCGELSEPAVAFHAKASQRIAIGPLGNCGEISHFLIPGERGMSSYARSASGALCSGQEFWVKIHMFCFRT